MFRKRYRQQIPELNTTSTADISFMLLIFFLVTSSMDTDKGLLRQMPPPPLDHEQPVDINKDLVMRVALDANGQLTCDGKTVSVRQLTDEVRTLAQVNRTGHVVSLQVDRQAAYEAYFEMQNAIVGAYRALREQYARERYGRSYGLCTSDEKAAVNAYYPQRISEAPTTEASSDGQKGGRV